MCVLSCNADDDRERRSWSDRGDTRQNGATPLHAAAVAGELIAARVLLDAEVDVNLVDNEGQTPLLRACWSGKSSKLVGLLLERQADMSLTDAECNSTPLHWACANGHDDIVEMMLQNGADLTAQDMVRLERDTNRAGTYL